MALVFAIGVKLLKLYKLYPGNGSFLARCGYKEPTNHTIEIFLTPPFSNYVCYIERKEVDQLQHLTLAMADVKFGI